MPSQLQQHQIKSDLHPAQWHYLLLSETCFLSSTLSFFLLTQFFLAGMFSLSSMSPPGLKLQNEWFSWLCKEPSKGFGIRNCCRKSSHGVNDVVGRLTVEIMASVMISVQNEGISWLADRRLSANVMCARPNYTDNTGYTGLLCARAK